MRSATATKKPHSIIQVVDELCQQMRRFDLQIQGYTAHSLAKFKTSDPIHQELILNALAFALNIIASAPKEIGPSDLDSFMLYKACRSMNLRVSKDFLEHVSQGDIIEIYDFKTQTQIYRNFEFLRHCSYDLLTVCILPYPELFEREAGFNEKIQQRTAEITLSSDRIQQRTAEITLSSDRTEPWNVPDHHLIEKLDSHHRKFLLKLGSIAPVYNAISNERVGWASTIRASNLGSSYRDLPNVVPI